ncbi:hypothetical protein BT93_L2208 [Corymbia citriodora subsp. variegata]|uniref:Uncharacterized protein n=1 Tax=Corymbia citriodora subsp. variegata TaxID=360336 RepID=A0A8T0CKU0_CORYI|nr:hypothetical protein BT93_L2208 [Corymbia citriodora subsp. variegata]
MSYGVLEVQTHPYYGGRFLAGHLFSIWRPLRLVLPSDQKFDRRMSTDCDMYSAYVFWMADLMHL